VQSLVELFKAGDPCPVCRRGTITATECTVAVQTHEKTYSSTVSSLACLVCKSDEKTLMRAAAELRRKSNPSLWRQARAKH
jgi:hypothetical protein